MRRHAVGGSFPGHERCQDDPLVDRRFLANPSWLQIASLGVGLSLLACPQVLDDRFRVGEAAPGAAGTANQSAMDGSAGAGDAQGGRGSSGGAAGADSSGGTDAGTGASSGTRAGGGSGGGGADLSDGAAPVLTCRQGSAEGPNGNCYLLFATVTDWPSARENCQALGSRWDIASIRNAADTAFLAPRVDTEMWVGASDAHTEGTWVWVADGTGFWSGNGLEGAAIASAYTNWNSDEPNGGGSSDCMRILDDAKWADLECEHARGYVCEGPPE